MVLTEVGSILFIGLFGSYQAAKNNQQVLEWLQLNLLRCLEMSAICFPFLFLGSLLAQFIYKSITWSCGQFKTGNQKAEKWNIKKFLPFGIKSTFSYKACFGCCLLLISTHSFTLLLLFVNEKARYYISEQEVIAETAQIFSWLISLGIVSSFPGTRTSKLPWLLRIWWILGFFQSLTQTVLHICSIIMHHNVLSMVEFTGLLSLLPCICLLVMSVRGSTGVSIVTSGILDPLLLGQEEEPTEYGKHSPYGNANLLQLLTFSWISPLLAVGVKKPLEQHEVPDLDASNSSEFLDNVFGEKWNYCKHSSKRPSLFRVIFLFIRKKAAMNVAFAVTSAIASYIGPYLIDDFVHFLSKKKQFSWEHGFALAFAFLGAKMVETVAQRQWMFGARQLGLRLRAALASHIFKKGLRLSSQAKKNHTSGELVNYMSVDIQRITDLFWHINIIWMLPIQISLAIYLLYRNLHLGSLAALASTILIMSCNVPLTKIQKNFQSDIMKCKDHRMKATTEVIRNMKTLKFQAWEIKYLQKLEWLRKIEYKWLHRSMTLSATSTFLFWGAPALISVVTFGACILMKIPLTAGGVLTALATFRMLQEPIFSLPDLLAALAQAKVSADRVASYFQEEEIQSDAVEFVPRNEVDYDVKISGGNFSWDLQSETLTLSGIDLTVLRGNKVAICGSVGSGKSSLLSCILGEIPRISGTVQTSGSRAYVPQSPWIQSGSIQDNILFGNEYNSAKYQKTIEACALEKDFELFAHADLTEVGERGINISGGQKQRIQHARAVYQDADIYLLDDPFSAVDAQTGNHLFMECLMGVLNEKTILYVTHQVQFLPAADVILVMHAGRITQAGKFEMLVQQNMQLEALVGAHSQALESVMIAGSSTNHKASRLLKEDVVSAELCPVIIREKKLKQKGGADCGNGGRLVRDEQREVGSIGKDIYWAYLTAVKNGALVPVVLFAMVSYQVLQVASNYWMAWASSSGSSQPLKGATFIFIVYSLLSVGSSLCVLVRSLLTGILGLLTSQKLFTGMLHSVIHAPMSFFDSTPTGRILNRVSTDQSVLDLDVANKLSRCATTIIQLTATIAVMSQAAWEVFVAFIPVAVLSVWYQRYYITTERELVRLVGIHRSPILHHFVESLSGTPVIRAFEHGNHFILANFSLIDNHTRPWFYSMGALEWLSFRLNFLSNTVFACSLVVLVVLPAEALNPSVAGLTVTYGLNLNVVLAFFIWGVSNVETKMVSVERIIQFSKLSTEAPMFIQQHIPSSTWPTVGTICFKNLYVRYATHLPFVLKDITCVFPGKKRIGVVGRTGSGKSTLAHVLFRIIEPTEGTIEIDDVDICSLGLHDVRARLGIVPQDPTMFDGTVRRNLDPLQECSDHEIWEALDKCQLGDVVRAKEDKLDAPVMENGENWSMGQRQLFCLARSLLKRSRILVLDEATASVDSATDGVIQQIILQEFVDQTIITIAHRIHTVINSDHILVLSEGQLQEYGSPAELLKNENSAFSKLIHEYSSRKSTLTTNNLSHLCR